jgi:hypothetical protein
MAKKYMKKSTEPSAEMRTPKEGKTKSPKTAESKIGLRTLVGTLPPSIPEPNCREFFAKGGH